MLVAITLMACGPGKTTATATENALCRAWGADLPTRSRHDTPQTQDEIEQAYATFANACPNHIHLIPGKGGTP